MIMGDINSPNAVNQIMFIKLFRFKVEAHIAYSVMSDITFYEIVTEHIFLSFSPSGRWDSLVFIFLFCPHTRFAGQKNNLYNGKG